MYRKPNNTDNKQGLIRSFIVIVLGVMFLSFAGFDLRTSVSEFQNEHTEELSFVNQVLFDTIIPRAETTIDEIREFADENNIDVQNLKKLFNKYKDSIPREEIERLTETVQN